MSDESHVEAGSETSGETAADTTVTEQSATDTTVTDTAATDTAQATDASADAGGAADETKDESPKAGDACVCPDGRKGTIHSYDTGLVCIPNENQSE